MSKSITKSSSQKYMYEHELTFFDYLRENHDEEDIDDVVQLLYHAYPDEGAKLIKNFGMHPVDKVVMLIKWIVHSPQITCLIMGDQRMGKDALVCRLFELIIWYCKNNDLLPPRIVTLGNVRRPPFVSQRDMYFSFMDIPFGTKEQPVYIYSSELEAEFPSREFASEENKLFSVLEGTMAQNHQKLFGCIKLTSKVDISVLRSCNVKLFKYISPEKLDIEGIERINILSDLGRWFLPKDVNDKSQCLMCFDNNLLTGAWKLPTFWNDEYSNQFQGGTISPEQIRAFIKSKSDIKDKLTPTQIFNLQMKVYNKFRQKVTSDFVEECFKVSAKSF